MCLFVTANVNVEVNFNERILKGLRLYVCRLFFAFKFKKKENQTLEGSPQREYIYR